MRIYLHIALRKEIALYKSLLLGRERGVDSDKERETEVQRYSGHPLYTACLLHAFTRLYTPLHASYTLFLDSIYSLVQMQ